MKSRVLNTVLASSAIVLAAAGMTVGPVDLPVGEMVGQLFAGERSASTIVFLELRVPRGVLGLLVGASLGLAGAAMQGLLRNPLAEPGIVGISGSAAFGAVVVFYSGLAALFSLALPLGGIAGAFVGVMVLFILSGRQASTLTIVLAGIAVNAFAGAATALALNLSPNPYAAFEIIFWQLGSFADRSFEHVLFAGPLMAVGWFMLLWRPGDLDALSLGEETAASLGVSLPHLRFRIIAGASFAVGAAVAVSGVIGFVGLVVPHLLRPLVGFQPSRLLLSSALGGAVLVLAADIFVRVLPTATELKIGVVTAIVGAPFFLLLIYRLRQEEV